MKPLDAHYSDLLAARATESVRGRTKNLKAMQAQFGGRL